MKFKFNRNLDYQLEAISAVTEIFDTGKNLLKNKDSFELQASPITSNELEVDETRIFENLINIQKQNNVDVIEKLDSMDFSVEMEIGTGKTYVYLRTILELKESIFYRPIMIKGKQVSVLMSQMRLFDVKRLFYKQGKVGDVELLKLKKDFVKLLLK